MIWRITSFLSRRASLTYSATLATAPPWQPWATKSSYIDFTCEPLGPHSSPPPCFLFPCSQSLRANNISSGSTKSKGDKAWAAPLPSSSCSQPEEAQDTLHPPREPGPDECCQVLLLCMQLSL